MEKRIQNSVPLAQFTTFHIGGSAEMFIQSDTEEELIEAVSYAHHQGIPFFLLGGGSNLVVADEGVKGLVIRNQAKDRIKIDVEKGLVSFSSGISLSQVVKISLQNGLTGMEPFTGIPGTLGGAIYGNAGAYGRCIADILIDAEILTFDGRVCYVKNSFFEFSYRDSVVKRSPFLVLNSTLKLGKGEPEKILAQMNDILAQRKSKHPPIEIGSAGSFFKNLAPKPGETRRQAAGEILEKAGAKSMAVGGASVYSKHANFIVNYGKATAEDVRRLAIQMKEKVQQVFGIDLHEEVLYIGN